MKIRNQGGFSAVEGLLIFIIVAIIAGTGWYVMSANNKTNDTLNNAGLGTAAKATKKKQTTPAPVAQADPTANWTAYSSKTGKYSLKYPNTWVRPANQQNCASDDDSFLMLGPTAQSVGSCGSDNTGEMYISSSSGDQRANSELSKTTFPDLLTQSVTVNGIQGEKISGTSNGNGQGLGFGTDDKGAKVVMYIFYTNGRTYTAAYYQNKYPDVQSDFDLMVAKTLKFSAN
jgi:hypothetical protein